MTDLKNMSVDELELHVLARTTHSVYDAAKEMARRLREQGQRIQSLEKTEKVSAYSAHEYENAALRHRTDQAESALLTCQAREAELRDACQAILDNTEDYHAQVKKVRSALSHSTGSKIMAVVEAVKGHYGWHQEHDPKTTCAICEKYRALEAKHE